MYRCSTRILVATIIGEQMRCNLIFRRISFRYQNRCVMRHHVPTSNVTTTGSIYSCYCESLFVIIDKNKNKCDFFPSRKIAFYFSPLALYNSTVTKLFYFSLPTNKRTR